MSTVRAETTAAARRAVLAAATVAVLAGGMLAGASCPALAQSEDEPRREAIVPRAQLEVPSDVLLRGRVDLNRATLDELLQLPIPAEIAQRIWTHRVYVDWFTSIHDLSQIEGITPQILATLWPLVATPPPDPKDEAMRRYDDGFRQVQMFLSQEGAREELAEEYLDHLRDPQDINTIDLYELQTFQNVSPVDAVAILKARRTAGRIESMRQLRSSEGLSYWGYRNLRDYVVYEPPVRDDRIHGDLQMVFFDTPYTLDERDLLLEPQPGVNPQDFENATGWGIRGLDNANPALLTKLRLRVGGQFKGGVMGFRSVGEEEWGETLKSYLAWTPPGHRAVRLDKLVLGNYRVAFGQGLVMDNTDYSLPRKTGTGFNKRPLTLLGDLSRTHEFALRGLAAEATAGPLHGIGFYSNARKDGLMNPDGSINKYIVMRPRFTDSELASLSTEDGQPLHLVRDAFDEEVFGGNLKLQITEGTYVGVSGYEARTDQPFNPDVNTLIAGANLDLLGPRDAELYEAYDSRAVSGDGDGINFRRVLGTEFQAVYRNMALQGEYAKLDSSPDQGLEGLLSSAPEAYVLNGWFQYADLTVQALWRDYDLGFDNPYARGFSNDFRYEQTLLGDPFRLQNPLLSWLALTDPQSKPERGLFLSTRYKVSRKLTITGLEYDQWERVADGQDARRWTARVEYAPIFPLRFRVRQRYSSRAELQLQDYRKFRSWDTRLEAQVRLSDYDALDILYSATNTQFATRPRLSEPVQTGPDLSPLGEGGSPGQAVQVRLTHNVNDRLTFMFSTEMYDGFLWNFEDNEFVALDDTGFRNWAMVRSRISDPLVLRFKVTHDRHLNVNNIDVRSFNDPAGSPIDGDNTRSAQTAFRLQLDYTF